MMPRRGLVLLALWSGGAAALRAEAALRRPAPASAGLRWPAHASRHAAPCAAAEAVNAEPLLRIGHGYDIHRMAPREEAGQPLVVGGVKYDGTTAPDFELGCVANSDGDVIYHSVVDAILGALTMPDIGQLFPDTAGGEWTGADSEIFMVEAYKRMRGRGYTIGNVDITLICQKPRINVEHAGRPVKRLMVENVARLLHTDVSLVNVKARTHEKVDSVGEARALECHVVLILQRE